MGRGVEVGVMTTVRFIYDVSYRCLHHLSEE